MHTVRIPRRGDIAGVDVTVTPTMWGVQKRTGRALLTLSAEDGNRFEQLVTADFLSALALACTALREALCSDGRP